MNTRCGLLGAADDARGVFGFLTVDANDQVGPIVEGQRGFELEGLVDAPVEVFGGLPVPSMNRMTFAGKPRCDLILCGKRVATRP